MANLELRSDIFLTHKKKNTRRNNQYNEINDTKQHGNRKHKIISEKEKRKMYKRSFLG